MPDGGSRVPWGSSSGWGPPGAAVGRETGRVPCLLLLVWMGGGLHCLAKGPSAVTADVSCLMPLVIAGVTVCALHCVRSAWHTEHCCMPTCCWAGLMWCCAAAHHPWVYHLIHPDDGVMCRHSVRHQPELVLWPHCKHHSFIYQFNSITTQAQVMWSDAVTHFVLRATCAT
jgi:hypothetical protein